MKIEEQVCTLEQAKRLMELGITAPAFFCWKYDYTPPIVISGRFKNTGQKHFGFNERPPAYTVAELGEMLPENNGIDYVYSYKVENAFGMGKTPWFINPPFSEIEKQNLFTEAQARAALLIHLLESNLLTADVVNKTENVCR